MSDFYSTGTVSVTGGATVVTGAGTLWLTAGVLSGDSLILDGRYATIASVDSNTQVTLASAWTGANQSGAAYTIRFDAPSRIKNVTLLAQVRELIAQAGIIKSARPNYEVQSLGANAPPGAPVTGDLYVVGPAPTGAWAGQANNLAQWTGSAWLITAPQRGATVVSAANGRVYIWSGSSWGIYTAPSAFVETLMDDANAPSFLATLGFSSFMQGLRDDADAAAARATLGAQAALGFTPVRQGTGPDQLGNQVSIGHSPIGPRLSVDSVDFGRDWTDVGAGYTAGQTSSIIKLPTGGMIQSGTLAATPNANGSVKISFPTIFVGSSPNCFCINGDANAITGVIGSTFDVTLASFGANVKNHDGTSQTSIMRINWIAHGRWK